MFLTLIKTKAKQKVNEVLKLRTARTKIRLLLREAVCETICETICAPGFECEGGFLVGVAPHTRHSAHAVVVAKKPELRVRKWFLDKMA